MKFTRMLLLQKTEPILKFCVDCKSFRNDPLSGKTAYGKCNLFFRKKDNENYLVNGKGKYTTSVEYWYCHIARKYDHMCGPNGKFFQHKGSGSRTEHSINDIRF